MYIYIYIYKYITTKTTIIVIGLKKIPNPGKAHCLKEVEIKDNVSN